MVPRVDDHVALRVIAALFTVTLIVVLVALWFVPAATFTVIVVVPAPFGATVTVVPLMLAVAMLVLADDTVIAPSPDLVTVLVPLLPPYVKVKLAGLTDTDPFALLIVTVISAVVAVVPLYALVAVTVVLYVPAFAPALNFKVAVPVVSVVGLIVKLVELETVYVHFPPPPAAVIVATLNAL